MTQVITSIKGGSEEEKKSDFLNIPNDRELKLYKILEENIFLTKDNLQEAFPELVSIIGDVINTSSTVQNIINNNITSIAETATFIIGPSSNSDSATYDYLTDGTDDDVQIQAAIDALPSTGGSICLREGTYTLGSASVLIAKNGVELFGTGAGTIITCKTNYNNHFFTLGDASVQYSNCIFREFKFDGNTANQSTAKDIINNQVSTIDLENLIIDSCVFINASKTNIRSTPESTFINKCYFSAWRAGEYGIVSNGEFKDCYFTHTSTTTIYTNGGDFVGCQFVFPASYNTIGMESGVRFVGNKVTIGDSAGTSADIVQSRLVVGNHFVTGTGFNGNLIAQTCIIADGNTFDIGASAGASCKVITGADIVTNNNIEFGLTANAASVGINASGIVENNRVTGAGIPITPLPITAAQFDKTTNTTLANVTGLTKTLLAGNTYEFEAVLFVDADATGGSKYAMAGTATATSIKYEIMLLDNATSAYTITSRQTALAGSAGQAGTTAGLCIIKGLIVVNAGGTLTVQFAQNASNGTSSVLTNSYLKVKLLT